MYIRRLTRALPATLVLALIWPAIAAASPINADLDADKVTESLESHIEGLPDRREVRLIVSLDRAATNGRIKALERAVGDLDVHHRFAIVDAVAVTATKGQVRELAAEGVVDRVEQSLPVYSDAEDGFSFASNDSAQESFGVAKARDDAFDRSLFDGDGDDDPGTYSPDDLVAAVIDSGIDTAHRDLDGGKVLAFEECIDEDRTDPHNPICETKAPSDDDGHGTHVAATIAGDGDGDPRYAGVAPGAALVGVKVLDENGDGDTEDVAAGIEWAVQHKEEYGIEAINLSLGSEGCGDGLGIDSQAVNAAVGAGLVVMVAAGNHGPDACTIGSPGDAKDAITVAAMADLGSNGFRLADFSGRGPTVDGRVKPDVAGPGVGITSALAGTVDEYAPLNGTSMATPFVTGVGLLMKDAEPSLAPHEIQIEMLSTAVDWGRSSVVDPEGHVVYGPPGSTGPDIDYGAGRLNAYDALAGADAFVDGETTLTSPPVLPLHHRREGSLGGTGEWLEFKVNVSDLSVPLGVTMIEVATTCSEQDFDLLLTAPNGAVTTEESPERQDELGYRPTATGVHKLRVYSWKGCGEFFVDFSGGTVLAGATANPDPPKATNPPPAAKPTPSRPARKPDDSAAFAAVANAARITARRATSRVRRVGLRRLLRRGRFTFAGLTHGAGRVQLAIRMRHRGRNVLVARATRYVSRAGKPRLNVRLTRTGRRLLRKVRRSARLSVRAAVTDSSKRRRYADRGVRVRR